MAVPRTVSDDRGFGGEGGSGADADFAAVLEHDESGAGAHSHTPDAAECPGVTFESVPVFVEPVEGTGLDEEVQIVRPAVVPASDERGSAPKDEVGFPADGSGKDGARPDQEFAGSGGEVEGGHGLEIAAGR